MNINDDGDDDMSSLQSQSQSHDEKQKQKQLIRFMTQYPQLLHQEDNVQRVPFNVTNWILYIDEIDSVLLDVQNNNNKNIGNNANKHNNNNNRNDSVQKLIQLRELIGRRAIEKLPRSYKLWKVHWEFVTKHYKTTTTTTTRSSIGEEVEEEGKDDENNNNIILVLQMFERALVTMHKFPRIWIDYLTYVHELYQQQQPSSVASSSLPLSATQLRRLANRALQALPVTQHDKIWPVLLKYYQTSEEANPYIPKETKLSLLRRYIEYNPAATKDVADFFANELGHWGEAALLYVKILNQPELTKSQRKDLWTSFANICTRHPVEETVGIDWEAIVRAVLTKKNQFLPEEMEGIVWSQLADSWIRRGKFQMARSVFEEALEAVSKVRDFTILLDAYLQFEEGLLEATMESQMDDVDEEENEEVKEGGDENVTMQENDEDDWDLLLAQHQPRSGVAASRLANTTATTTTTTSTSDMADLELALARAEDLTARRPLLLNRVLLRQNPHDVGEWLKRARLYKQNNQIPHAAAALEEALKTVHARRAVGGSASELVLTLVKIYEEDCQDLTKARQLLDSICNQWIYEFKNVDELAECIAAWVELELRHEAWDEALDIARQSVVVPPKAPKMVRGLAKSLRLWDLLLDLEESLGTIQTAKDAYGRAIEKRIVTPLHILNFASFLSEHKYFEESFTAFERGLELFEYPGVKVIWKAYLDAFLGRYKGTKVERTRDLFQRCLEVCPSEESAEFFLQYGTFEEDHGLTKRALGVYRQMCQKVPPKEKYVAYQLYITKTTKYLGQTATRDIYQSAIEDLDDTTAAQLCLDFARMETSLKEIDRARAVLSYGAQMVDPRRDEEYWKEWNEFEIAHGNEETFREMLRIKRSVEAAFSTVNYNAAEMSTTGSKVGTLSNEEAMKMIAEREGVELDHQPQRLQGDGTTTTMPGFVSAKKRSAPDEDNTETAVAAAAVTGDGPVFKKVRKLDPANQQQHQDEEEEEVLHDSNNNEDADADEIDLDDLDDDDDDEEDDEDEADNGNDIDNDNAVIQNVKTKAVPAAVLGGLAKMT